MKSARSTLVILMVFHCLSSVRDANSQEDWAGTPQGAFRNSDVVQTYQCVTCHTVAEGGGTVGPNLNLVGLRRSESWLRKWLSDPQKVKPGTRMPTFEFTPEQLEQAVGHLTKMKRELNTDEILAKGGTAVEKGKLLFADYDCSACHRIGSEGRFVGPDLTFLGVRKTVEWERTWLADPEAFKAGTFMPNFHIPEEGVNALAAFVASQTGQENSESQGWEFMTNFFLGNNAKERGELVFKRFACWSCHGEKGKGGIANPNMAPEGVMPSLKKAANKYTAEQLLARLKERVVPEPLEASEPAPPFFCPDYGNHMSEGEFDDLYAYLKSIAPRKARFRFK